MKNWFFFFNSEQSSRVNEIKNVNRESYKTWVFLTVILPLAPFSASILIHFFFYGFDSWGEVINNGSLPIISYGLISSGILYLLEKVDKENVVIQQIKKRIMALALLLLFFTAALFIIQSIYVSTAGTVALETKKIQNIILLVLSIGLFWYSMRIGENMFLLQKKNLEGEGTYDNDVRVGAVEMGHGQNWK